MRKIVKTILKTIVPAIVLVSTSSGVSEGKTVQHYVPSEVTCYTGPGKNYRTNIARQYFGKNKCRNWKRFCGR